MTGMDLCTPLGYEVFSLRAGDRVTLSGLVYTARDEAHEKMMKEGIPFEPCGAAVYHCGPIIHEGQILSAGPTTSARMNNLSGFLITQGVRALIGKGGMSGLVVKQLKDRGVYLAFTGGCAALAASRMKLKGVYFKELGMAEAIWVIELDHLPLVVGIDAHGGDIFDDVRRKAKVQFMARFNGKKGQVP